MIAHGLYSWVPNPVRQKSLRLIKHSLAPHGIAFVSFNAYPGWHHLGALRDMMLYRTRNITDPVEKVRAARDFIAMVAEAEAGEGAFASFAREYYANSHGRGQMPESQLVATLLHDELSEVNQPFYISEFVENVNSEGLDYLVEADLEGSTPAGIGSEVLSKLSSFTTSRTDMDQYLDFLRNRLFRKALLCHAEAPVTRTLNAGAQVLQGLYVGTAAAPKVDESGDGRVTFVTTDELSYSTDEPLLQASLRCLAELRPDVILFEDLLAKAIARSGKSSAQDGDTLAAALIGNFAHGRSLVHFHVWRPPVFPSVSEKPLVTAYARLIAGDDIDDTTNVRHERATMTPLGKAIIPLLDGRNGVAELLSVARAALDDSVSENDVRQELRWLARTSMFLA